MLAGMVYFGCRHLFRTDNPPNLSRFNFDGDAANDFFNTSVCGAGDVNGDGVADLIISAPFTHWLVLGSDSALQTVPRVKIATIIFSVAASPY
jgi:hypothetical protein